MKKNNLKVKYYYLEAYKNIIKLIEESEKIGDYENSFKFKRALLLIKNGVDKIENN
tara:strand:+ start:765 stop:932 length:168 start_codon:yes stop_codon:yes gene_type:complete